MQEHLEPFEYLKNSPRPATPGSLIEALLEERGAEVDSLASALDIPETLATELLQGNAKVTPDLSHRLGHCFNNQPSSWLELQYLVDFWDLWHMGESAYQSLHPLIDLFHK